MSCHPERNTVSFRAQYAVIPSGARNLALCSNDLASFGPHQDSERDSSLRSE